ESLPRVGAPDPELKNSPIVDESRLCEQPAPTEFGLQEGVCYFKGGSYPIGACVQSGSEALQRTEGGIWAYKGEREEPPLE
ncbi:MAG TPA: hypothetical protein VFK15_07755, partial [Burkholderiales bacterium]|nr:hypothetical protein [Burkholderiales bacterium]